MTTNPLSKYFRVPKLNTTVPSRFKNYDSSVVEPSDGEVSVLPMTAADEMIFKNPDNLLNGSAVTKIISSCIPQVKHPEKLFTNDLNALIVAIRIATYGEVMKISTPCPECSKSNNYDINMTDALEGMNFLEEEYSITNKDNVKITINPVSFEDTMGVVRLQFDQSKISRTLSNDNLSDEQRMSILSSIFEKMATVNAEVITNSVSKIEIIDESIVVTDKKHIDEFMKNTDAITAKNISDKLEKINDIGVPNKMQVECEGCNHTWMTEMDYNPVDFFTKS